MGTKKHDIKSALYWIHTLIGVAIIAIFCVLPYSEPLTKEGIIVLGIFIASIYWWSTVGIFWPSMVALLIIGLLQIGGTFSEVMSSAFGSETVLSIAFSLIFFAGIATLGCTKYIANMFLKIKAIEGRPYVFLIVMMLCSYVVSGLTIPLTGMLLTFPIVTNILEKVGYKKGDRVFAATILGLYLAATLGQPLFPFKGAAFVVYGAYKSSFEIAPAYAPLIIASIIAAVIMCVIYLIVIKLIFRPDFSKLKALKAEDLVQDDLPPMNIQQKLYLTVLVIYIILMVVPGFFPSSSFALITVLNNLGTLGVTLIAIAALALIRISGQPAMNVQVTASQGFEWGIYFMVASGVYLSSLIVNADLGITAFLRTALAPVFGGKPDIVFVLMVLALAVVLTQVGANAGIAIMMFPIAAAFTEVYPNVNMVALCMTVLLISFVAMCTPAASPYAAVLHSKRDLVSITSIEKFYLPILVISIFVYTFIIYPLLNALL